MLDFKALQEEFIAGFSEAFDTPIRSVVIGGTIWLMVGAIGVFVFLTGSSLTSTLWQMAAALGGAFLTVFGVQYLRIVLERREQEGRGGPADDSETDERPGASPTPS